LIGEYMTKPAITVKVRGRQQHAIASALFHAFSEYFDVTYEGPNGEPLEAKVADKRIFKLCQGRRLKAVVKVE